MRNPRIERIALNGDRAVDELQDGLSLAEVMHGIGRRAHTRDEARSAITRLGNMIDAGWNEEEGYTL